MMQCKQIDQDISIIAEEIPSIRSDALLSQQKLKIESIANETVDLTQSQPIMTKPVESVSNIQDLMTQIKPQIGVNYVRPRIQPNVVQVPTIPSQVSRGNDAKNINSANGSQIVSNASNGVAQILPTKSQYPNLNSDSSDPSNNDIFLPTLQELFTTINARQGISSISDLKAIPSVNVHELFKTTPAECFSRKGFYSCAGCSSKFTTSEMYNFHLQRQIGDFSYNCEHCLSTISTTNPCQIVMHLLANHKVVNPSLDDVSCKSLLSSSESTDIIGDNFEESSKNNMKKVIEGFLSNWNVDLFNAYQRRTKDQRYFLLPLARKDVVQSHKFYSDHYRAANHKLRDYPVELMHCFMCDFVCENHNDLIAHLQGDWPNSVTKCAFCTLSVSINKESLCAAKAHVLLHMGIFMMCPRCGFVPPPDLNPDDFEITLRLHLRYVCFHFNLIQIFICPQCGDSNSKAFNTANQVIHHMYDEHLVEQRYCALCRTSSSDTQLATGLTFTEMSTHLSSTHNRADIKNFWNECVSAGKKCSECSDLISHRESFYSHMTVHHKTQIVKGKSAYRCFGTCKRIHQSIDEFQSHRSECAECINVKNKLYQPHLETMEATSLCFCLYCGVGVRRKLLESGEVEIKSEPQMFANLTETHRHEQDHILCETNITACPWCPNRMSAKVNEMTHHMGTHLPDNWFLNWYTKRNERYHSNADDVLYCYCYSTIDNPLSLHCHAIPQMLVPPSSVTTSNKHAALTDAIHREFITNLRHSVSGICPICTDADVITNSLEMTWHIFFKHRNILCYVCKNYRLLNADCSPNSRVTMWNHVHHCLRQHTPRFNMTNGLDLLKNIANCKTVMAKCTDFDFKKVTEISVAFNVEQPAPSEQAPSSGGTELANSHNSDSRFECGYCRDTSSNSKQFSSRLLLNEHLKVSHGITNESPNNGIEYLCFVCGVKFDCIDKWEDHVLTEHAKGFRKNGVSVLNPMSVVLDTTCTTYRCYLCNHRFDKKLSCEAHMKTRHAIDHNDLNWGMLTDNSVTSDASKRLKPSINSSKTCLLTYPCKRLKIERTGSEKDSSFVCAICPWQCSARKEMISHALSFHSQSTERSLNSAHCFMCPDCSLSFITKKSRSIHLRLIHKVDSPERFIDTLIRSL